MFELLKRIFPFRMRPLHPFILFAFLTCFLYWGYLLVTTKMMIAFDAVGYQNTARNLCDKGWIHFFQNGPEREPLYLYIISLSMKMARGLPLSYQTILKIFNFCFLGLTQFLSLKLLKKLKVNPYLAGGVVLYLGFSPSLMNSALRLWSEIGTYPLVLFVVLAGVRAWSSGQTRYQPFQPGAAVWLGLSLLAATSIKAVFEISSLFFLAAFLYFPVKALMEKNKTFLIRSTVFILIASLSFFIPLNGYKYLNKKYNGHFVLTNRGSWALYGNTIRRMQKLSAKDFAADLAMSVDPDFCQRFFDRQKCAYWTARHSDDISAAKTEELDKQNMPPEEQDKFFEKMSFKAIGKNPFQFGLCVLIESVKGLFWEGRMGFTVYPDWLDKIYWPLSAGYVLRWTMAGATLLALLFSFVCLCRNAKKIFRVPAQNNEESAVILFNIFLLLVPFMGLYSVFFILYRYIFTVVPLYLMLMAFAAQQSFDVIARRFKKN